MGVRTKNFLMNVTVTVAALAAAYTICEVVVRALYKDEAKLFPRYHTDYRYGPYTIRGIRPNAEYWMTSVDGSWKFVTNSKGHRNARDITYDKPTDSIRVLSLGDSHTQGYEARQDFTFSAILERFLKHHSMNAEVINSGVSGFSTAEALVFLENEGIKYSPDVVVLGFSANDFEDNLKAGLFGLDASNHLIEKKFEHLPGVRIQNIIYSIPPVRWLSENSYFYSLLFNNIWYHFKAKLAQEAEYAVATSTKSSGYQIALTAALIERMQRFCAEHRIRFILVDIPYMSGRYRYASAVPRELLERLAAVRIEYIASQPLLQKFDGVAEIHAPHGDHHITEYTHTLIGTEIGQRLLASVNRNELASSALLKP